MKDSDEIVNLSDSGGVVGWAMTFPSLSESRSKSSSDDSLISFEGSRI
jgi:hypothetical protein